MSILLSLQPLHTLTILNHQSTIDWNNFLWGPHSIPAMQPSGSGIWSQHFWARDGKHRVFRSDITDILFFGWCYMPLKWIYLKWIRFLPFLCLNGFGVNREIFTTKLNWCGFAPQGSWSNMKNYPCQHIPSEAFNRRIYRIFRMLRRYPVIAIE